MTQLMDAPATSLAKNGNGIGNVPTRPQRQSALAAMASRFAIDPARLMDVLKATVIKGTNGRHVSDEEVAAFIVVANQYGLNPFTREIHAFADSQKGIVPIVGIDGWAHLVNDEKRFDGCDFEDVKSDDQKDWGITCTMYVNDRSHPIRITEWHSECKRNTPPWNNMKRRMLRHKAFMQAARLAFSISGIYDEDEAKDILQGEIVGTPTDPTQTRSKQLTERITKRPVSENQILEPTPEEIERAAQEYQAEGAPKPDEQPTANEATVIDAAEAQPAPAQDESHVANFTNYEGFRLAMIDLAIEKGVGEADMGKMISAAVLGKGMKGKEQQIGVEVLRRWYQDFVEGKGFFKVKES